MVGRSGRVSRIFAVVAVAICFFCMGYFTKEAGAEIPRYGYSEQVSLGNQYPDRVMPEQIKVYKDKVEIDIKNAKYAPIKATDSMLPLLHGGAHSIEVDVEDVSTLKVGDIISYYNPSLDKVIIHSIVKMGLDESGWYAITKGLNNEVEDGLKVRSFMVRGVLVGVVY